MRRYSLTVLSVLAGCNAALADCQPNYSARVRTRSDGVIANAKAGQPCVVSAYLNSPTMRASGTTLQAIEVVRQPKRGRVQAGGASFTYTPDARFTGKDSFFISFIFTTSGGQRARAGVRFAVRG